MFTKGKLVTLHLRQLHDAGISCRAGTTDVMVLEDTFFDEYHVPPDSLAPIKTILDLGSNIGLTIAHYATLFPGARIVGIELDLRNADVCRHNIANHGLRCEIIQGAAWTNDGMVCYEGNAEWTFHVTGSSDSHSGIMAFGMQSLIERLGTPTVDFVKMDIEGAEKDILAQCEGWIGRVRCLKVEIHKPYTVPECLAQLQGAGMICHTDEDHFACVTAYNPALGCD